MESCVPVCEYEKVERVFVCSPSQQALERIEKHDYGRYLFRSWPERLDGFIEEHAELITLLRQSGLEVLDIAGMNLTRRVRDLLQYLPNMMFARDGVIMTPLGALLANMGTEERRLETEVMEEVCEVNDIPIIDRTPATVCIEGGDVIFIKPDVIFLGYGPRTSLSAIEYIWDLLGRQHGLIKEVIGVEITPERINLDGVLMPINERLLLMDRSAIVSKILRYDGRRKQLIEMNTLLDDYQMDVIEVSREEGLMLATNVFHLGHNKIVAYAHNKRVNNELRRIGFDLGEIQGKYLISGSGGPRCMTNPIRCDFMH